MRRLAFLLLLVCAVPAFAQSFRNPVRLPISDIPVTALAGDLNGDGRPDLVAASTTATGGTTLHVLLAQAAGGFKETASPTAVIGSAHCLLADVTRDNLLDVVCGNPNTSTFSVTVLPGKGDGTFGNAIVSPIVNNSGYTLGIYIPQAAADLNGDGNVDLVVGTLYPGTVTVLYGDGAGSFRQVSQVSVQTQVDSVDVADLNGDGHPDLVAKNSLGFAVTTVLLNKGDGTFPASQTYSNASLLADADNDGHPDLLGSSTARGLAFYHGNPDGTFNQTAFFSQAINSGAGNFGPILSYADRNHDGVPDIVMRANNGLTVLLGKSGSPFAVAAHAPEAAYTVNYPSDAVLDLDRDGNVDIVSAGPDALYINYGRADGAFAFSDVYQAGYVVTAAIVADFTGDGIPDVITSGDTALNLSVGRGDGTFRPAQAIAGTGVGPTALGTALVHGDFNGDGKQDLLVLDHNGSINPSFFLFGKGDGTFAPAVLASSSLLSVQQSSVRDFNGDGLDDFAVPDNVYFGPTSLTVYLLGPNGATKAVPTGLTPSSFGFADLDGYGKLDLVTLTGSQLQVLPGRGDGSFAPATTVSAAAPSAATVVLGDFDGDGRKDIALVTAPNPNGVANPARVAATLYYNNGAGLFASPITTPLDLQTSLSLAFAADLDGDGLDDLFFSAGYALAGASPIHYRRGLQNRTLSEESGVIAGVLHGVVTAADLNGDGKLDLVAGNIEPAGNSNTFTVLLNGVSGGGTAPAPPVTPLPVGTSTALGVTPNPANVGQNVVFSVRITAPTQTVQPSLFQNTTVTLTGLPGGAVTLPVAATRVTGGSGASTASANYNPSSLAPGTYTLTAHYSGNSDTLASDSPSVQLVVLAAATTATLTASPNPAYQAQTVHLSVTVSGQGTPDGVVTFLDGGQSIGSAALNNGTAALDVATLAVGTHTLTIHYGGSALFAPSDSNTVAEVILPSDFTLTADPGSLSMRAGRHVTVRITATSVGNFSGNLRFSTDTALPQYATAMILQPRVALSAGGTGSTSFYVDTDQVLGFYQSSTQAPARVFSGRGPLLALLCFVPGLLAFRRPRVRLLLLAAACTLLLPGLSGCGDHNPLATPPGDYALHVTAVSESSGQSHTLVVPLHITP